MSTPKIDLSPVGGTPTTPVRDVPSEPLTPEDAAAFTRQQERLDAFGRGEPDPHPPRELPWREQAAAMGIPDATAEQFLAAAAERASHPLQTLLGGPHVATLPDGTRLNLPAGTVLREGMTWEGGPPADPIRDLCEALKATPDPALAAMLSKLRAQVDRAASPLLDLARDLLQRARIRLVDEPAAKKLDAEIVAFLAGAAPPEHPLFALVRRFVGKPGDKPGPVWTALMCVQARLDDDDLAGAKAAATALEEALNERLGQMHDALGRDPIAEVSR